MIMFLSPRKAAAPKGNNAKGAVSAAADPAG
jgi:hypothetical protein